jgi:hypothetical protein
MELEGSLPFTKKSTIHPYPEPVESSLGPHTQLCKTEVPNYLKICHFSYNWKHYEHNFKSANDV